MSDAKNPDQSIFQALSKFFNGEPPKLERVKQLPSVTAPGKLIYERTMTPEFKSLEQSADAIAKEKWGVPAMHWLIARFDNPRERAKRSYCALYDYVLSASARNGIDPNFLHIVAMGEGLNDYIMLKQGFDLERKGKIIKGLPEGHCPLATQREKNIVDSYGTAGLDDIGNLLGQLKGYLDPQYSSLIFPYDRDDGENEIGLPVRPAKMHGIDTVIFATSAYLQILTIELKEYLTTSGLAYVINEPDKFYFLLYAFFNGPDFAKSDIKKMGVEQYTRKHSTNKSEDEVRDQMERSQKRVRFNSVVRMCAFERMKLLNIYGPYIKTK